MNDTLGFYSTPGLITQIGTHADLLSDLPDDIAGLCRVVQGVLLHVFWAQQYAVALSEARKEEVQLRFVSKQLARIRELDPHPLVVARPPEKRLVGNCRDFSVLLAALLRHRGIPARARCGFGRYFIPGHFEDHWVCEYWQADAGRWALADAQLDELQCRMLSIAFDPLDVPRDQFIVGGKAWQLCRAGEADPDAFGLFDMHGLGYVRGNFVRDVAALNKMELLPWDCWGLACRRKDEVTAADLTFLDKVAELTCEDVPDFSSVHALFKADDRLRVPPAVQSYSWSTGLYTAELTVG